MNPENIYDGAASFDNYDQNSYIMMNKNKLIYFRKTHKLLINSILIQNNLHIHYSSASNANTQPIVSTTIIQPSKIIEIVSVDKLQYGRQTLDSQVIFDMYLCESNLKILKASVTFDLSREKIMSINSPQFFRKNIKGKDFQGYIQYKFIGILTAEINQQTYRQGLQHKNEVELFQKNIEFDKEYKKMLKIVEEKDNIIKTLSQRMETLTKQTKKLSLDIKENSPPKQPVIKLNPPISLSINMKPSNPIQIEYKRLIKQNQVFKTRMFKMGEVIQKLEIQKSINQNQVERLNNQLNKMVLAQYVEKPLTDIEDNKKSIISVKLYKESSFQNKSQIAIKKPANELGQNSQIRKKKGAQDKQLKNQIQVATKFDDLVADKELLLNKLKGSIKEIESLQGEIENQRENNKKLNNEISLLKRTNNINRQNVLAKIQAIKSQNQRSLDNLKKSHDETTINQLLVKQKQKLMIDKELLKSQISQLQKKKAQVQNQNRLKNQQYESKIRTLAAKQKQLTKERDKSKAQLQQAKVSLLRQKSNTKIEIKKSLSSSVVLASQDSDSFMKKNEKQWKGESGKKQKDSDEILRLKSVDSLNLNLNIKLKQNENMIKFLNKKIQNYKNQIEEYENNYKKLKEYGEFVKNLIERHNTREEERKYGEQVLKQISTFEELLKKIEDQYYNHLFNALKAQKQQTMQYYYKELFNVKREIDERQISLEEKNVLKKQKQNELQKQKKIKSDEIEERLKKIKSKRQEQVLIEMNLNLNVHDRIIKIQKAIKLITEKQEKLRQENEKLNESLQEQKHQIIDTGQPNKMKYSLELYRSTIKASANMANEEIKNKHYAEWKNLLDESNKKYRRVVDECNKFRTQLKQTKVILDNNKREYERSVINLQRQIKEKEKSLINNQANWTKEKANLSKKIEYFQNKLTNCSAQNQQLEKVIRMLQTQIKKFHEEYTLKFQQNRQNQLIINQLSQELDIFKKMYYKLVQQVKQLKKVHEEEKRQFDRLLEERSSAFSHIEQLKKTEISNLTRIKEELQFKLQEQINENFKIKGQNSQFIQSNNFLANKNKEYEVSLALLQDSLAEYKKEIGEQLKVSQEQNQQLKNNLIDLANEISKTQQENTKFYIQNNAAIKEVQLFKELQSSFDQFKKEKQLQRAQLEIVIIDKQEQIKKFENNFMLLQQKIRNVTDENTKIKDQFDQRSAIIQDLKQQVYKKNFQMVKVVQEKSLLTITLAKKQNEIQEMKKKIEESLQQVKNLSQQNQQLKENIKISDLKLEQMQKSLKEATSQHEHKQKIKPKFQRKPSSQNMPSFHKVVQNVQSVKITPEESKIKQDKEINQSIPAPNHKQNSIIQELNESKEQYQPVKDIQQQNSPQMHFIETNKQDYIEQRNQIIRQIHELQQQKNNLLKEINCFRQQLQVIKHAASKPVPQNNNIKIDELSVEENTNEATFQIQKQSIQNQTLRATQEHLDLQRVNSENKIAELQLLVQGLEKQKNSLQQALEEQKMNSQKLLLVEQEVKKLHEDYSQKINEIYTQHDQKIKEYRQQKRDYQQKIEEILAELMKKEETLAKTFQELQNAQQKLHNCQLMISDLQQSKEEKEEQQHLLEKSIKKLKIQFCKYEQDAELEILMLKEKFDQAVNQSKVKDDQLIELGERYLLLEEGVKQQQHQYQKLQQKLQLAVNENLHLQQACKKVQTQNQEFNQNRKPLLKKIQELQRELISQHEVIADANQNASLGIVKFNIKIESLTKELQDMKHRQEEKQKTILTLKNEISLYNDECLQLKKINEELDYSLQKVTKELKDIMVNYESEFEQMKKSHKKNEGIALNMEAAVREKEKSLERIMKQFRDLERQKLKVQEELRQMKNNFEKYKNLKQKQINDKTNEIQLKINDFELLKATHNKLVEESQTFQAKLDQEKQKYKIILKDYKQKMEKYDENMEQLSKEIQALSDRPTKQAWQKLSFEHSLYKNRIYELEQQLKQRFSRSNVQQMQIQNEFRKFKANKQAVIKNLEQQLETYASKKNQVEQSNYYLKRQNDSLKIQFNRISQENEELQDEIKHLLEDMTELREQVQFYKQKRRHGLTKLLNETDS